MSEIKDQFDHRNPNPDIDYSIIILTPSEQEQSDMEGKKKKYFRERAKANEQLRDKEYCGKDYYQIRAGQCKFADVFHGNIHCTKCDQR